jgi:hypothetical protein
LASSGNPLVTTAEWNIKYDDISHTNILLAFGNFKEWMIVTKIELETAVTSDQSYM